MLTPLARLRTALLRTALRQARPSRHPRYPRPPRPDRPEPMPVIRWY
jgi:hypothetical protein